MKKIMTAFFVGLLFSVGLGLSGMTNPENVISFLDLFGNWNPSLLFVMVGAIGVHSPLYRILQKLPKPLFDSQWHIPTSRKITPALVIGAFLFGVGWALAGYCPGPAIVSMATLSPAISLFMLGLLGGMLLFKGLDKILKFQR